MAGIPAPLPGFVVGKRVRVWWPPTDDEDRTDYGGMYWPVTVRKIMSRGYKVLYDNGEEEFVRKEHVHPADPPVEFGAEQIPLQAGEFVEVFNGSQKDPGAWLGKVEVVKGGSYLVSYPFHDANPEEVQAALLRRARIFEHETGQWKIIKPGQTWEDGEIESPVELETVTPRELARYLSRGWQKAESGSDKDVAKNSRTGKSRDNGTEQVADSKLGVQKVRNEAGAGITKRKGPPTRLR